MDQDELLNIGVAFLNAVQAAGLPFRIFSPIFKMDGRRFGGWQFRGVPPELAVAVREVTRHLKLLVKAKRLPADLYTLAWKGIEAYSEELRNAGGDDEVPETGTSRPA
jgi:hypothetical protein